MTSKLEEQMKEQKRLFRSLTNVINNIRKAEDSFYWSWTREFELGQLNAARMLLTAVVKGLKEQ